MTTPEPVRPPIRIGNASGFYGDRFAAMRQMLTDGPLDVLTGDYLAELTMLILGRDRLRDPGLGYAKTFLRQLEECLGLARDRGVRIVVNAGGLNPAGLADAVRKLAADLGLPTSVGHVEGDDLLGRAAELGFGDPAPLTANAYLGCWGIVECLRAGADVVVTGRVTDASLVVGPAAWHHGWARDDWDALAGATVAGHVLECGAQATGGNYAFFDRLADVRHPGFPLAEVHADGSSVITKHPGTGGAVARGTVTAQLLYEIDSPQYLGPDVVSGFDTIELSGDGPHRIRISGVRGTPPPATLKVGINRLGGYRNAMTFVLTGLDRAEKADLVTAQLTEALQPDPPELTWTLADTAHEDAGTEAAASSLLHVVARDADPARVGRVFSRAAVELALASYPGFFVTAPPGDAAPYGVFEAAWVDQRAVEHVAVRPDGTRVPVPAPPELAERVRGRPLVQPALPGDLGPTRPAPLGLVVGARSGDKGGMANIGVWTWPEAAYRWLVGMLTVERLHELLPETAAYPTTRHLLPNLLALNFVVDGLLGAGVAASTRFDPQAKALGEWLRSRCVEIPVSLLDGGP